MNNELIDESINLEGIYEQCNEHLREQDRKRDQLLAFFGTVIGLIIANIEFLSRVRYILFIYLCFILVSIMLSDVIINYMKWHSIYNYSAITLQNLMLFKQKTITQTMVNKIYYQVSENKSFSIKHYLQKTETKILNVYLFISSINIFIYAYILSLKLANATWNLIIIIGAIGGTILYLLFMNKRAYKVLRGIFKPNNVDYSKPPSWIINLYEHKDYLYELLNRDHVYQCSNAYYEVAITQHEVALTSKNQGVAILPMTSDERVLLISIYRKNIDRIVVEIPRGFCEKGETYLEAARRELKEETNCEALEYIDLGYIYPDSGITNSKIQLYLAKKCKVDNIKLQEKELINEYVLLKINEVIEKINSGEINDSFTIAAVFKALSYVNN